MRRGRQSIPCSGGGYTAGGDLPLGLVARITHSLVRLSRTIRWRSAAHLTHSLDTIISAIKRMSPWSILRLNTLHLWNPRRHFQLIRSSFPVRHSLGVGKEGASSASGDSPISPDGPNSHMGTPRTHPCRRSTLKSVQYCKRRQADCRLGRVSDRAVPCRSFAIAPDCYP